MSSNNCTPWYILKLLTQLNSLLTSGCDVHNLFTFQLKISQNTIYVLIFVDV